MPKATDPSAGVRVRLNRARVLEAAVTLADSEGIDSLTMRRLGRELGVEAMALYNHVKNKDELLDGMLEWVAEEIELPDAGGDWQYNVRQQSISAHSALLRHPWSATLWVSSINVGPARMRYLDGALRYLREAGFPPDVLDRAFHTIENHIVGHALQTVGFPLDRAEMTEVGERLMRSFPTAEYPDLAAHIRHHLAHEDDDDAFTFGLDLILGSLEQMRSTPLGREVTADGR